MTRQQFKRIALPFLIVFAVWRFIVFHVPLPPAEKQLHEELREQAWGEVD